MLLLCYYVIIIIIVVVFVVIIIIMFIIIIIIIMFYFLVIPIIAYKIHVFAKTMLLSMLFYVLFPCDTSLHQRSPSTLVLAIADM